MSWGDVNARARGVATHLLRREALERLAGAPGVRELLDGLLATGVALDLEGLLPLTASGLDRGVGRVAAARLALLERWLGPRREALAIVYERFEVDNLRRLLRGLAHGASAEVRMQGLVPTPGLPERALARLAGATTLDALAQMLRRLGHPAGRALALGAEAPALLQGELNLLRLFVTRAVRLARHQDALLRQYVALTIDCYNAWSLLQRDAWGDRLEPPDAWLPGGRAISRDGFLDLAAESDPARRRERLAARLEPPFRELLADPTIPVGDLEAGALRLWLRHFRVVALRQPLGPAPLLYTVLRIEAEARDLRSLVWGVAMQAPAELLRAGLLAA